MQDREVDRLSAMMLGNTLEQMADIADRLGDILSSLRREMDEAENEQQTVIRKIQSAIDLDDKTAHDYAVELQNTSNNYDIYRKAYILAEGMHRDMGDAIGFRRALKKARDLGLISDSDIVNE